MKTKVFKLSYLSRRKHRGIHLIKVTKANSNNSKAVIGVVEYKVIVRDDTSNKVENAEIQKKFLHADGNVRPNDYLTITVFGPADVKENSRESIKIGETLTSENGLAKKIRTTEINGITIAENVGVLGKALEDSNGRGKIKVFVTCR